MNRHEQRQAAFKQVSAVRQVLTTMPKADTTKKTFMEHILGTPNSRYEKAKNNFLEKLNRVTSCSTDFTYKVDFNIPEGESPVHYIVKAKEALTTLTFNESDPVVLGYIDEAIKAANELLSLPVPTTNTNDAEMSR